jgi:transcriptional regulator with XRE-family HTH domain
MVGGSVESDTTTARIRVRLTPGQMLRTLRELQEMSQADLANTSGVSQPAISAIESGAAIGRDRAVKLATALRVHPAVLMFPDWEPGEVSEGQPFKSIAKTKPSRLPKTGRASRSIGARASAKSAKPTKGRRSRALEKA